MKVSAPVPAAPPTTTTEKLQVAAVDLEAVFLAEMLKSSGLGETRGSFGGGVGEDQFSSFLVQQQARALAESGGIGLSEILFRSMMEKANAEQI